MSLAPNSVTFNCEVTLSLMITAIKSVLAAQIEQDFLHASIPYPGPGKTVSTIDADPDECHHKVAIIDRHELNLAQRTRHGN